jgi:hypothetical protein
MKSTYLNKIIMAVLALSFGILACEKEKEIQAPWDTVGPDTEFAQIRIIHGATNFRTITGQADSLHFFVNGAKINNTRMSFGGVWPAQTPTTYTSVPAGNVNLKVSVGGIVNIDSIAITTLKLNLAAGERYSFMLTDSLLNASKDSSRIFVRDSFPTPLNGRVGVRFVNLLTDTAGKRIDIWSARRNANLFANVPYGTISSFTNQPFINIADTLIIRRTGTTQEFARINTITLANQKVYTIFVRGDVLLSTGAKARTLTWVTNR